ncbi:MAG: insulinase family protein, partial [Candidatus Nanoarchaeia archaeon]
NMVSLLVSILANPLLSDENFMAEHLNTKRKELLLAEKRRKLDKQSIAGRGFMETAIGKCIYTMDVAGTEEDILAVSHADCSTAYIRQLCEMPKKIFAGTNLEPEYIAGIVEKNFGCMPKTDSIITLPDAPEKKEHSRVEREFPCDQSLVFAGIPFDIPESTKEKRALNILTFYLGGYAGGRLFTEIRLKRDMAYGAYASIDPHLGIIYGHAGIDRANKDAVVDIMLEEFRKAAKGKITKSGLEKAKSYLLNQRKMNLHSKEMKLSVIESAALEGRMDELKNYEQAYMDITPEDVINAASRLKFAPIVYCLLQQEKK